VDYEPGYNSTELEFKNATQGRYGLMSYEWDIDEGGFSTQYYTEDAKHTFYTDGKYTVCLTAAGCAGFDKFCKDIDIVTPNTKTKLDFVANDRRPDIGEEVTLKIDADNANQFEWSIFPTTYVVTGGSTATSSNKELKVRFSGGGPYTFTLKGWNTNNQTATQATVVKDKYVIVLNYCTPVVGLKSADVGINNVVLRKGTQTLMSNETESGVEGYTDYTATKSATMTFGAQYNVEVSRNTTVNPMNRKVWIDFNIDGGLADLAGSATKIQAALEADPAIDGIFALNADIATGAALVASDNTGRNAIIGTVDMSADALTAIKDGKMAFAVDQQQYAQGYMSVVLLFLNVTNAHELGGGLPIYTGPGFVTADNVDKVMELVAAGTR
jgi:hypothetical protein